MNGIQFCLLDCLRRIDHFCFLICRFAVACALSRHFLNNKWYFHRVNGEKTFFSPVLPRHSACWPWQWRGFWQPVNSFARPYYLWWKPILRPFFIIPICIRFTLTYRQFSVVHFCISFSSIVFISFSVCHRISGCSKLSSTFFITSITW